MLTIPAAVILASLCQAPMSGWTDESVSIYRCDFESVDIGGNKVDQAEIPTTGSPIFLEMAPREDGLPTPKQTAGFHFEESWTPKLPGYGFYRFRATVASDGGIELGRSISAVVIRDIGGGISNDFGCEPRKSAGRGVFLTIK